MKATIKKLIFEINNDGWLVSNLYQMDYAHWRCNLRKAGIKEAHAEGYTTYAEDGTAFKALSEAWYNAQDIDEKKVKEKAKQKKSTRYRMKS